jgi:ubiquitin carboxyl-terminal hydrolase L5
MDILNSDLQLRCEAHSKKRSKSQDSNDFESGFHFIAFMPAMGQVWKFDGLERQPRALGEFPCHGLPRLFLTSLGECSEGDWLELAMPNIIDRMAAYTEDSIEFSILGVVRDPLSDLIQQLAVNVRSLEVINERLLSQGEGSPEREANLEALKETVLGPEPALGLTRADIEAAVVPDSIQDCQDSSSEQLRQHQQELSQAQIGLRGRIREQQQAQRADEDHATGRRYDYGPAIRTWLRFLARKQLLAELLQ